MHNELPGNHTGIDLGMGAKWFGLCDVDLSGI